MQPKVCQVLYSFDVGGSERLAEQLCARFSEAGVSIDLCATRSGFGVISRRLQDKGHTCLALDLERYPRILRPLLKIRLAFWFRRRKISALLVHHLPMLNDVYAAAKFAGVKQIAVVEHTAKTLRADRKFRRLAQRVLRLPVKFVAVNPDVESAMVEIMPSLAGQIEVIRNGVDTVEFYPRDRESADKRPPEFVVGWIGRLHPVKDILTAIRAFELACERVERNMRLIIIGDGEQRALVVDAIASSPRGSQIDYQGQREDIQEAMRMFDLFLISSTEEGTPLTLLEAMSTGLPIVSTNVGGIPEVVDNKIGLLVSPKDETGMAESIAKLVRDTALRTQLGQAARERAVANYGLEKASDTYLKILDCERPSPPHCEITRKENRQ